MTNLQHFLTRKILQNLPAAFLNNKTSPWPNFNISINTETTTDTYLHAKLLHDQPSTFLRTKLLHDQSSTFLYSNTTTWPTFNILKNKTTTWPIFNISLQQDYYMTNLQHFLTTKLLQKQPPEILNNKTTTWPNLIFLNNKSTTWPTFNIS